jgi:hypothetical protein
MLLYGSGISDGNSHLHGNLPVLLFGGGANPIPGGRRFRYPKDTPMSNLFMAMLARLGMPKRVLATAPARSTFSATPKARPLWN